MSVDLVMEDARWKTLNLLQITNAAFKETLSQLNLRSENFICCILACSSKKIKGLNAQFRGKNNSTNVLSFPSTPQIHDVSSMSKFESNIDPFELGDIAIAYEVCKKEADVSNIDFEDHVYHLITHSVLHLLGYDHEEEENAAKMEKIEVQVLAKLGINNPYL
jgi:probable rRNA maturation factor